MESSTQNLDELNETGKRASGDRRTQEKTVAKERRKVQRRRLIDPTTCERDYTNDEIEFMQAMDEYKRKSGRMFPTCSEILEVLRGMGYVRLENPQQEEEIVEPVAPTRSTGSLRTSDMIVEDFDQLDEIEAEFDDDLDDDEYDEE